MIGKGFLNSIRKTWSIEPEYDEKVEIPLFEYRVEFTNGDVRTYYANDHRLEDGFLILEDIDGIMKMRATGDLLTDYKYEDVKVLGNVLDMEDEAIGTDVYEAVPPDGGNIIEYELTREYDR